MAFRRLLYVCLLTTLVTSTAMAEKKKLTFTDLMKLRTVHDPAIADDGSWIAFEARPDRGDGEVIVRATNGDAEHRIARGAAPAITPDGRFVVAKVTATLEAREKAKDEKKDDQPKDDLAVLATADGSVVATYARVKAFALSDDGAWLAVHHEKPAKEEKKDGEEAEAGAGEESPAETAGGESPAETAGEETTAEEATAEETHAEAPIEEAPIEEAPIEEAPREETPGEETTAEEATAEETTEEPGSKDGKEGEKKKDERVGTTLVLRRLADGTERTVEHVESFAFAERGRHVAWAVAAPKGDGNGLFVLDLALEGAEPILLAGETRGRYTALAWAKEADHLGFVAALDDEDGEPGDGTLWIWRAAVAGGSGAQVAVAADAAPDGWFLPSANELAFSRDGARLFFGWKPVAEKVEKDEKDAKKPSGDEAEGADEETPFDPYDVDALLADRGVDVWHWNDPLINSNQKKQWEEREKARVYRAVHHLEGGRTVPLADTEVRQVAPVDNADAALGVADTPYLKEVTWDGRWGDVHHIDLQTGARRLVAERVREPDARNEGARLSPGGRYVVYYRVPHWYLWDAATGEARNLTGSLGVPFADEDHDYPEPAPGYGVADWVRAEGEDEATAVLIYDKFDVWSFPVDRGGEPRRVTGGHGRETSLRYRLIDLDAERDGVRPDEALLLEGYHDREKHQGFYRARVDGEAVEPLRVGEALHRFVARAEEAERLLFTRERFDEFPDLWTADLDLRGARKLTDVNPELADYAWGTAELVDWTSADGTPLQGVLIKPAGYLEGQRVPVLVYYYRFFSQRLHEFNDPAVNHRPSFPLYAADGYAIFLPDVVFEIGRPGHSAVQALVPGVQKLIDMGVADPDAIGLHGHSWSGYQTAFVVTQTDFFAAAVAGAPVSNMTSAYGGIRWGTGLARQFQYEQSQSRLGASLWEARDRYIDNSPLFFADRVHTPLLLMFGDEDDAVPWYQGIELYLALRRLGKEAVFLQYRGEGHHLKKYPNRLDYAIKMKEFFDHHLKGEPAPDWWSTGVAYRGK